MGLIKEDIFVCVDCESTGLDTNKDSVIEVAVQVFTFDKVIERFESLVDPKCKIPQESIEIHHITQSMVEGKPRVGEVLPTVIKLIEKYPIVGHGIKFDIDLLTNAAALCGIPCKIKKNTAIDTLRLARLYGRSASNSLDMLRAHFNIPSTGFVHRAMEDVSVNIEVFKKLIPNHCTKTEQLIKLLNRPILLKDMPFGKYKGRPFSEIPINFLRWAVNKDFDGDLLFTLKSELKKRKTGNSFAQLSNPFGGL